MTLLGALVVLQYLRRSNLDFLHTSDKPRDAFRGHSRSPNMVPFDMLC